MNTSRTGSWYGRIGWLATTILLAIALLAGSWTGYRGARAAADTVNRGQADRFEAALRTRAFDMMDEPLQAVLDTFIATQWNAGVRYVALLDPDGRIENESGEPLTDVTLPPVDSIFDSRPLVDLGDRIRAFTIRRPTPISADSSEALRRAGVFRNSERADAANSASTRQPAQSGRQAPRFHRTMIEFEPVLADELEAQAVRTLLLSSIGATILTLAALLFWRISEKYERAQVRLEEQKRLSILGEMSAVLAHEIRNPLASLKGHAQLLAEKLPGDSKERTRADRVINEATRLEALTSDLLDFARTGPLEMKAVDPVDVLRTSIEDVAAANFEVDTSHAPVRWSMDASRIRQILGNVLQNAQQASPSRAPRVRVAEEEGALVFEVQDFGPGLPPGTEARIFEPFFTTRTNGTGLGLAVARRVAELHGGRITARNHDDGGAVFRLELPAAGKS